MKKRIFIAVLGMAFFMSYQTALAGNSAIANAGANLYADITPQSFNSSGSTSETNVGINNQPVNLAAGGTAFASGGFSNASNGDQLMQLGIDLSSGDSYNRQHRVGPGVAAAPAPQNFEGSETNAGWNIFPITPMSYKNGNKDVKIEFVRKSLKVYQVFPKTGGAYLRGNLFDTFTRKYTFIPPTGKYCAIFSAVATIDYTVEDLVDYAVAIATSDEVGADQVDVIDYGGRRAPTIEGWSLGTQGGASGLLGPAEEMAISGGGGTNIYKSEFVTETQPWVIFKMWRSNEPAKTITTGYKFNKHKKVSTPVDFKVVGEDVQ